MAITAKVCACCSGQMPASRTTKTYCSTRCRVAAHRAKSKQHKQLHGQQEGDNAQNNR